MKQIKINKISTPQDLKHAFVIRKKVFVDGQGVPANEEYDEFDDTANHFLVLFDAEPIGTARWRKTKDGVKLERFAVLDNYRNKGVGIMLISSVLEDVPKPSYVYLHAQLPAKNVYERAGFKVVGEKFMECNIEHYKMQMNW